MRIAAGEGGQRWRMKMADEELMTVMKMEYAPSHGTVCDRYWAGHHRWWRAYGQLGDRRVLILGLWTTVVDIGAKGRLR